MPSIFSIGFFSPTNIALSTSFFENFTSELRFKADPSKGIKSGLGMALETEPYPIDQEKRKLSTDQADYFRLIGTVN